MRRFIILSHDQGIVIILQDDKTVLSLMDELKTPRAKDIIHVILGKLPRLSFYHTRGCRSIENLVLIYFVYEEKIC